MPTTVDWFSSELSIEARDSSGENYCSECGPDDDDWCSDCDNCTCCDGACCFCPSCGRDDSDWCDDCSGCRYSECDTCSCEHDYEVTVTYRVTVAARNSDDIDSSMLHEACQYSSPDDWEIDY